MKKRALPPYSEYRIQDVIGRLEGFRNTVGWGQLNEDLEIAIECLSYVEESIKDEDEALSEAISETLAADKKPHWIVHDHGFAGKYYRCSKCGKGHWQDVHESHKNYCYHCFTNMEGPDEHRR